MTIGICVIDPRLARDAAGALEDRREVAVQIAGIALPAGHFAARRGHLAQRLAVVRHVVQHDEHVQAEVERQVLGGGQRAARRDQPLGGRIVGEVHECHDAVPRARRAECVLVAQRDVARQAERRKDDREALDARRVRLRDDLHRQRVVRQSGLGEDRQLLPEHDAVERIDRRNARLEEVARKLAPDGLIGEPSIGTLFGDERRRQSVARPAHAVEDAAEQFAADAEASADGRGSARASVRAPAPRSSPNTSMIAVSPVTASTRPACIRPSWRRHFDVFVKRHAAHAVDERQRSAQACADPDTPARHGGHDGAPRASSAAHSRSTAASNSSKSASAASPISDFARADLASDGQVRKRVRRHPALDRREAARVDAQQQPEQPVLADSASTSHPPGRRRSDGGTRPRTAVP